MSQELLTLCTAAAVGAVLVSVSGRLRIPPIVLLLIGGVLLGPEGLGVVAPLSLGGGLNLVVGMTVAVILFEGGMTLDLKGARESTVAITRILTIGVLVTWVGAALTVWLIFDTKLSIAVLCGSLVVVTGPTVVAPILRRLNIQERLKHILFWESVLVDAIGVFLAVLCFEWISPDLYHGDWSPLTRFMIRVAAGLGIGAGSGLLVAVALRRHWIQDEHVNIVVLGASLLIFAVAESVLHESGVLAVIIAGLCLAIARPHQLRQLKRFKLELTELGIGTLFILLAGTLRLSQFQELGWGLLLAVGVLTLVVRPVAIVLSTWGRGFSLQDKIFLSWVAPRGIVAAFLASLFALELGADPSLQFEALLVHTFTFAVIGITVIVQGLSAPIVARLLGLVKGDAKAWLVVGEASIVAPMIQAFKAAGVDAVGLGIGHGSDLEQTRSDDLLLADPLDRELREHARFSDVSDVLVISPNLYFNELVCERWVSRVGQAHCHHWSDSAPSSDENQRLVGSAIWSHAGLPTDLLSLLEQGSVAISAVNIREDRAPVGPHQLPLLRLRSGATSVMQAEQQDHVPGDTLVVLRKRVPGLINLVRSSVLVAESNADFDTVLTALLAEAATQQPSLPTASLKQLIVAREKTMSTAVGAGVAIPHAYSDELTHPQCYVASIPKGMNTETPDGLPVRLAFLVLSPSAQAESHLKSLATVASMCSDSDFLSLLSAQANASDLLQRIRERE